MVAALLFSCLGAPPPPAGDSGSPPVPPADSGAPLDLWVSGPTTVDALRQLVGSPSGWLILSNPTGYRLQVQRVASNGNLADPASVPITPFAQHYRGLWTGSEYAVVAVTNQDYYDLVATLDVLRVPVAGPIPPVSHRVGEGLGWPGDLQGACDGVGACVVALKDAHWLATGETLRLSFDAAGATAPIAPIGAGESRRPLDAVRDGDRTLLALGGGSEPSGLAWLPDDPTQAAESLIPTPGMRLAAGPNGISLAAESHYEPNGDSGLPLGAWSVRAERVQHGVGLLDADPIDLGPGILAGVAHTGATFVVALIDADVPYLVRMEADGLAGERIPVVGAPTAAPILASGPAGHLLWGTTLIAADPPFFVRIEVDVPAGGACSDNAGCLSGVCDAGACD